VKLTLLWVRTKKWTYRDLTLLCVTKANISLSNYLTELDHWYWIAKTHWHSLDVLMLIW